MSTDAARTEWYETSDAEDWLPANAKTMLSENPARNESAWARVELQRRRTPDGSWQVHGLLRAFDAAGTLRAEITYADGAFGGPTTFYHANGRILRSSVHHGHTLDGPIVEYADSGTVIRTAMYRGGTRVGPQRTYYESGRLKYESHYDENGRMHGHTISWSEDGAEVGREVAVHGRTVLSISYGPDGDVTNVVVPIAEGSLVVSRPRGEKQMIMLIPNDSDIEHPVTLPE
ncbi:MAG: hypothetical protein KDA25_01220, partial [Phycisphaerales bacterium]|nr:hypothetical protein [Phycisphaerales bacterium]